MNSKEFKTLFKEIAISHEFKQAFGGWYKESDECIAILILQKSNYGDYYNFNMKIVVKEIFGRIYKVDKDLMKSSSGHIIKQVINETLSFDKPMDDELRKGQLMELFKNTILPFINMLMSKANIIDLERKGEIKLFPAVKEELEKMNA